jgi:peptide/nickel transport system substrate-binding protein
MAHGPTATTICLILTALVAGCATPAPPPGVDAGAENAARGSVPAKRIVVGTPIEPDLRPAGAGARRTIWPLVHPGLSVRDGMGAQRPTLVETVPSLENGLWKLLPDGRMETTWTLRAGIRWHDDAPLTTDDVLFALSLGRDPELPEFNNLAYAEIAEVTALDRRSLTITWKGPYIGADGLFSQPFRPLPRHLLEPVYRDQKTTLLESPYWTQEFVGVGPFRIREWTSGLSVRLDANPDFVLGRPPIDEIELTIIPDANTRSANVLAGAIDVTLLGSVDLGLQLRDQWRDGAVVFNLGSGLWTALYPQFIDPRPAIVAEARFRRALFQAIDRQELVDTLLGGMSPVPHSMLDPNRPDYRAIDASVPRIPYDPRRSAALLEELGYARGPDGAYQDATGQRLEVDVRSDNDQRFKAGTAIASYWQRLGVATTEVRSPPQRAQDFEYIATFPAFEVNGQMTESLRVLHSSATMLPGNNFRVQSGGNRSRYMSPELDALIETYYRTVPMPARLQALGQIVRHTADQLTHLGLYYNPDPAAVSDRLRNVSPQWSGVFIGWNVHEWEVTR